MRVCDILPYKLDNYSIDHRVSSRLCDVTIIFISILLYLGTTNSFVQVIIIDLLSAAIVCKFIEDQGNNVKSCSIAYEPVEMCDNLSVNHSLITNATVTSNSVILNLAILSESIGKEYCYVVTATNGSFTAMVKGIFTTGTVPKDKCLRLVLSGNYLVLFYSM